MVHNEVSYDISYRDIKYPRIEFTTGKLLFVLPHNFEPEIILKKHKKWIIRKRTFIEDCLKEAENKKLAERSEQEFMEMVYYQVDSIAEGLDEKPNKIYFKTMKTKWASCSEKRNITINTLMKFLPGRLIQYVIYHEMVHLKQRKHNDIFWEIISRKFENYEPLEKELFIYWFLIAKLSADRKT